MRKLLRRVQEWLDETHSSGFELRRHFFRRFFDSEFVASPGQLKVVAGGALAILISLSVIFSQAYYHKYLVLHGLPSPETFRLAVMADVLFIIVLAMAAIGLFITLQWPSLFPGLRDYMALASLPVRVRDIFVAKFAALLCFAGLFTVAVTLPPSLNLPLLIMPGRYAVNIHLQVPGIFVSSSLAAMFVFFSLVAIQGVLLNILPIRHFPRVSLALQGILLTMLLCALPLVISIPNLYSSMNLRPSWAVWLPPLWFLGLDQAIVGNWEPLAVRLAQLSVEGTFGAAAAALATYLWSYRRHRVRVLQSPALSQVSGRFWPAALSARIVRDPRELAVFAFIAKILARSRQHRLLLTAFAGIALAIIFESFVSLALSGGFHAFSIRTPALRQAAISAPLALSLFVLAGFRYLFRLPMDLPANWVFRINERGNELALLAGVERFLLYCAVLPVAALTLPLEMRLLGAADGLIASLVCVPPSLALMELLLIPFEKIPFTSSYLPGKRPLIDTVMRYSIGAGIYVTGLSGIVSVCLPSAGATLVLASLLAGVWWKVRRARLDPRQAGRLEFEEVPEPTVQTLSIERD